MRWPAALHPCLHHSRLHVCCLRCNCHEETVDICTHVALNGTRQYASWDSAGANAAGECNENGGGHGVDNTASCTTANDAAINDGATNDGTTDDGATDDGTTDDGTTNDGAASSDMLDATYGDCRPWCANGCARVGGGGCDGSGAECAECAAFSFRPFKNCPSS